MWPGESKAFSNDSCTCCVRVDIIFYAEYSRDTEIVVLPYLAPYSVNNGWATGGQWATSDNHVPFLYGPCYILKCTTNESNDTLCRLQENFNRYFALKIIFVIIVDESLNKSSASCYRFENWSRLWRVSHSKTILNQIKLIIVINLVSVKIQEVHLDWFKIKLICV